MGIQINGQTDRISAVDGSFGIQDLAELNISGIVTAASANFTGNVSVGGTLTYQDVTNIDSVGIITARSAIVLSDDNAIHFRGTAADDADAILRASAGGGQLLINSRNDTIINIDSNNDSTDAHFAIAHGAATGSSTELFRVQEDGKIGVGENSPDRLLHIKGASSTAYSGGSDTADYNFLKIENTTNDKSAGVFFLIGSNGEAAITATEVADGATDIAFQNRGGGVRSEKVRITSAGNIGINQTNPTRKLHITTASGSDTAGSTDSHLLFDVADDSGPGWVQRVYDSGGGSGGQDGSFAIDRQYNGSWSNAVIIKRDTGNIGMGTDNPQSLLSLHQSGGGFEVNANSGSNNARLLSYDRPAGVYREMTFQALSYGFETSGTERLRIASNGKVHIGGNGTGTDQLNIIGAGNGINISRVNSGNPSVNEWLGAVGFKGYASGNSSSGADARIHAVASHNHSGSSAPASLIFSTKPTTTGPGSSPTERMRITYDGYVLKSNHPCFDAVRGSGHVSATTYIIYNSVKANNGGHYNSSNGRFTAPVAGYYFFSWTTIKNNTNTVTRLYIHKNGSSAYGDRHLRLDNGQVYGDNGTMTAVIQLAKNDYVQIYLGAGSVYGATEEYCIFNGYLLG